MEIFFVNNSYKVEVKLIGLSREVSDKPVVKRGPECLPDDFE